MTPMFNLEKFQGRILVQNSSYANTCCWALYPVIYLLEHSLIANKRQEVDVNFLYLIISENKIYSMLRPAILISSSKSKLKIYDKCQNPCENETVFFGKRVLCLIGGLHEVLQLCRAAKQHNIRQAVT